MKEEPKNSLKAFEEALQKNEKIVLRLFVSGMTPTSMRAIQNLEKICKQYLDDRYRLEVIDIYQHPEESRNEQIIAAPTLVKKLPLPLRRFIGDLSDKERILVGLDILPKGSQNENDDISSRK